MCDISPVLGFWITSTRLSSPNCFYRIEWESKQWFIVPTKKCFVLSCLDTDSVGYSSILCSLLYNDKYVKSAARGNWIKHVALQKAPNLASKLSFLRYWYGISIYLKPPCHPQGVELTFPPPPPRSFVLLKMTPFVSSPTMDTLTFKYAPFPKITETLIFFTVLFLWNR